MKFILLTRTDGVQVLVNLLDVSGIVEYDDFCYVALMSMSNNRRSRGFKVVETMKQICELIDNALGE